MKDLLSQERAPLPLLPDILWMAEVSSLAKRRSQQKTAVVDSVIGYKENHTLYGILNAYMLLGKVVCSTQKGTPFNQAWSSTPLQPAVAH